MTMLIKTFVTPPSNLQMPGLLVEKLSAGSHPYILITKRSLIRRRHSGERHYNLMGLSSYPIREAPCT
jgi:hypothetical protein